MTNIVTPSGGPFTVTIAYNVNFTNCSASVNAISTNEGPSTIPQASVQNIGTGITFQIIGGLGGSGSVAKGCIVAIGI
jgi:hypothetical protein